MALWALPRLASLAIFDRAAIAQGELWRLATGSLVHYSGAHLLANLWVFGAVGWWAERRRDRVFWLLCAIAPWGIGVALFMLRPQMDRYAGLSGLAVAVVVYVGLRGLSGEGASRWLCAAVLVGVGAKLGFELVLGVSVFGAGWSGDFVLAPISHLAGAATALALVLATPRRSPPQA